MKYFVYEDANYDSRMFRFLDQKSINEVVKIIKKHGSDRTKANLKSFTKKGHKLLMYHGWSDPAFSPFVSVNYFNSVQQILGSGSATTDNVRLFMVPRMHHCQGFGLGPNTFDELTPLIQWVEQCVAPEGSSRATISTTTRIGRLIVRCRSARIRRLRNITARAR
jgi:hypothetical protein